jgi:hypothetical protein
MKSLVLCSNMVMAIDVAGRWYIEGSFVDDKMAPDTT